MREHFLLDPDVVFLNHGSFGACPRTVIAAQHAWQFEMERNPVEFLCRRATGLLLHARTQLARALGGRGEDLMFVPNATTGVNIVAQSLNLQPGDEVLSTDLEYGACEAAFAIACARRGATFRRVEIPLPYRREQVIERLLTAVTPRTRMIFLSHITSTTALILPVAEVCAAARARGIATLIDGAHAPGQIDVNVSAIGADFYTGNCHKWQCAPKGSAFLHARAEHHASLDATVISWGYVDGIAEQADAREFLGTTEYERRLHWQGTRDFSAWLAVENALQFQEEFDWPNVRNRCHDVARYVHDTLVKRNGSQPIADHSDWAQMVCIPVPTQNATELRERLFRENRIEIAVMTHRERVFARLSVQGYTTEEDIDCFLNAAAMR
jgi:isopenicillin-N epimerase